MRPGDDKKKILVIEDDDSMRELLRLHLANAGYGVALAQDVVEAGREFLASPPDLVISDVHLPYMSGLEFASVLMADTTLPHVPFLLISAHEEHRDRAEALGASFLRKPILKEKLLEAVARALVPSPSAAVRTQGAGEPRPDVPWVHETPSQATLRRARDLSGGVTYLARKVGVASGLLDLMIAGVFKAPEWVLERAEAFVKEAESANTTPRGLPADWNSPRWLLSA